MLLSQLTAEISASNQIKADSKGCPSLSSTAESLPWKLDGSRVAKRCETRDAAGVCAPSTLYRIILFKEELQRIHQTLLPTSVTHFDISVKHKEGREIICSETWFAICSQMALLLLLKGLLCSTLCCKIGIWRLFMSTVNADQLFYVL